MHGPEQEILRETRVTASKRTMDVSDLSPPSSGIQLMAHDGTYLNGKFAAGVTNPCEQTRQQ